MSDEKDLELFYKHSKENQVEFFGKKEEGDLKSFFKVVDFLASRYGLGGFKSLEEFAEMVNQTDPVVLNYLRMCAVENENEKWNGIEETETDKDKDTYKHVSDDNINVERSKIATLRSKKQYGKSDRQNVRNLLREFGINKEDLDKACEKIDARKIELKDYSWIDNAELATMSQEKFKKTLQDMSKDNKNSINFNISDETIRQKWRKMSGRE